MSSPPVLIFNPMKKLFTLAFTLLTFSILFHHFARADMMEGPPRSPFANKLIGAPTGGKGFFYANNYGVLCDGTDDDTMAFAAAITAMPANGGTLIVQNGICIVSNITLNKSITLLGQGWAGTAGTAATEIRGNSVSQPVISITAAYAQVNNMLITSSVAAASRTGPGISITGGLDSLLNVQVVGHQFGIHTTVPGTQMTNVIQSFANLDGIWLDGDAAHTGATGAVLNYVQANANTLGSGIVITGNSAGFGAGVQMYNSSGTANGASGTVLSGNVNDIYMNQSGGGSNSLFGIDMRFHTGANISISQCLIEQEAGGAGINIGSTSSMVNIGGCVITGSTSGIISAGSYVSISNTNFSSNSTDAILLNTGAAHTVLSGLVLKGANTNGIHFAGSGAILCSAVDFQTATNPRFGALPGGSVVAACPGF